MPSDAAPAPGERIPSDAGFTPPENGPRIAGPARETRTAASEAPQVPESGVIVTPPETETPPDLETPPVSAASKGSNEGGSGGGGFFAMLLGGIAAGLIGFAVARYALPEPPEPAPAGPDLSEDVSDLAAQIAAIGDRLEALGDGEASIPGVTPEDLQAMAEDGARALADLDARLSEIAPELSALSDRISGVEAQIDPMLQRIEGLEARPVPEETNLGDAAVEARVEEFRNLLDEELAAARAQMQTAREEAASVVEEARAEARRSEDRAQLAQIETALATGRPYADALSSITASVPDDLAGPASEGVPTLSALQEDFVPAARAALAVAPRGDGSSSVLGRVGSFLREQTNARSLTPQEGESVDAILSRAEAAVNGGDLAGAVSELSALPEGPAGEMAGWMSRARTRIAATGAFMALEDTLNAK